jgi:hypothetical protein
MLFSDKKLYIGEDHQPQPTAVKTLVAGTITGIGASLVIGVNVIANDRPPLERTRPRVVIRVSS